MLEVVEGRHEEKKSHQTASRKWTSTNMWLKRNRRGGPTCGVWNGAYQYHLRHAIGTETDGAPQNNEAVRHESQEVVYKYGFCSVLCFQLWLVLPGIVA